jgi:hypothetical protein
MMTKSLDQAVRTFLSYDKQFHDNLNGGYDETGLLAVKDTGSLPSGRLSKPLDIVLHTIEAFHQLHKVVKDPAVSKIVADRILELLQIAADHTLQGKKSKAVNDPLLSAHAGTKAWTLSQIPPPFALWSQTYSMTQLNTENCKTCFYQ